MHEPAQLVCFREFATRSAAAGREQELKQLLLRDRHAVLSLVLRFQDNVRHVYPLVCPAPLPGLCGGRRQNRQQSNAGGFKDPPDGRGRCQNRRQSNAGGGTGVD